MIKAFLFDYDGVITSGVKDDIPATRLARNLGVNFEQASEWIVSIWDGFSTGKLSEQKAWQKIEEQYGMPITNEQRDIWYAWDELKPLEEMVELVQLVKSKGYHVGLLSNVLPVSARLIREHGGYEGFDFLTLSCEVGARKPDSKVYETALANLQGIKPEEIVFLDDRESCTTAASQLGMIAIQVNDHKKAIEQVHTIVNKLVTPTTQLRSRYP